MRARLEKIGLAVVALSFVVEDALARPGGGGSYHGGGGGGGGGGSFHTGGGGGGFGVGTSSSSSSGSPAGFVVIMLIVLVIVFIQIRRRASAGSSALAASPNDGMPATTASLDALRSNDPGLSEASIANHVSRMADILRQAWCAGDMRPARPFVSDGILSRFQVQLELMRQENRRNVMSDARVLSATVEGVEAGGSLDVVHVRVTAEARDTEVQTAATDEQIRHALSRASVEPYTEIWSLVRRRGAQSKAPGFDVGRACPSCGAPLDQGEMIKCRYCGTLACSGEHDWVIAEITQVVEWRKTVREAIGLDLLQSRDPGVAPEVLEDRASYVFWKWVQAGRMGGLSPLRKCAAAGLLANGGGYCHLEATRGASDVAVGGSDLVGCEVGDADGFDRAYVEIFWSARFGGSPTYTPSKIVMRLMRRSGVVSKLSMTALVCQACGAPVIESDSTTCEHCRSELAAGNQAWVLDAVLSPDQVRLGRPGAGAGQS
jgi:hypothetical protein